MGFYHQHTFRHVFLLQVSIIARQVGPHLAAYQTVAGDQLEILYHGSLSVKVSFKQVKAWA